MRDADQHLTCNNCQSDLTCNLTEENETGEQFMPNGSKKAGSTVYIYFLYNIAVLLVIITHSCTLGTAEKLVRVLQWENSGISVF